VSIVVLARLLSPSDYGLLAMVTAVIGVGELLRDLGLSVAAVQSRTLSAGEKSNLFWVNTLIGAVLTALVFSLSWAISALYDQPELVTITQVLALTFFLNGIAAQFKAQINRDLRFMVLGVCEAAPQAMGLLIAILVALQGGGYWALVAQAMVVAGSALILDVLCARWRPGLPDRRVSIRRFLRFGGALAGTQGLAYVAKNIDNVLLGVFYGSGVLGIYSRAYQLIVLPLNQMTAPLSRVAIPILSRLQDDREKFVRYLKSGQFFTVTLSAVFYGSMIGLADPIVRVVLGDRWLAVIPVLQALSISGVFRAMGQVPYWIFVALGLTGRQFKIYAVSQPIVIIAILLGVPWGGVGVALGCSIGYLLFWFVQMWWAGRVSGISTLSLIGSGLGLVCLIGIPVVAIGFAVTSAFDSAMSSLGVGLLGVFAYTAIITLAVPAYRRQLQTVFTILKRRRA